jgi:hypothetical protein
MAIKLDFLPVANASNYDFELFEYEADVVVGKINQP